jgi:hypothetical protein
MNATYAVITAELAVPIGSFNEEAEMRKLKSALEGGAPAEDPSKAAGSQLRSPLGSRASERTRQQLNSGLSFNEADAIFERMIIIIPYRAPETVAQIERSFERINMQGLGFENVRYLNTKEFTAEERANRKLDFVAGVELMDSESRIYIFEGLGGEGRAMH